jgi:uncharacterized membrane protein
MNNAVVTHPVPNSPEADLPREGEELLPGGHPMEIYISYVLRIGVLISAAIIFVGSALYVAGIGSNDGNPKQLDDILGGGGRSIPVSPSTIFHGITAGNPIAIIQLGVLALILTPMTRVAMTAALFMVERDKIFVVITSIVFVVLVLGLIGAGS